MKRHSFAVGSIHSFSRGIARKYGVNAALLLAFFAHRIPAVQAARKDARGYYTSAAALARHYPYLKPNTIKYALRKLRTAGVLLVDNQNRMACDRTLWYRFANTADQLAALEDPIRFNVDAATRFGVEAAMVLANLKYWIDQNTKLDNRNIWLRVSPAKLAEHLPVSERTIRRVLDRLVEVHKVLDREVSNTCDRASRYCFLASNSQRPNPTERGPLSSIHQPEPTEHRPICDHERPNPPTYTLCEDNHCEDSVAKNPCENPVIDTTAEPWVVRSTNILTGTSNQESSVQAINASGGDSGTDNLAQQPNSGAAVPVEPGYESRPIGVSRYNYRDQSEYLARCELYVSPYAQWEDSAELTAEQKTRVFRAGVVSLRQIGSPAGETPFRIVYDSKSFELARRFFELNPDVSAGDLLMVLNGCMLETMANSVAEDSYDSLFYVRRCNNITFFLRYLSKLEFAQNAGLLGQCTFLDDVDVSLRTVPEQLMAIVSGEAPQGFTVDDSKVEALEISQAGRSAPIQQETEAIYS